MHIPDLSAPLLAIPDASADSCLKRTLLTLPTERLRVFKLSRIDGMRNSEIAAKLEITVKEVEQHLAQTLLALVHAVPDLRCNPSDSCNAPDGRQSKRTALTQTGPI